MADFIRALGWMKEGKKVRVENFGHKDMWMHLRGNEIMISNMGYRGFDYHAGMISSNQWEIYKENEEISTGRLKFTETSGCWSFENEEGLVLGHLEKVRVGKWMHWCLFLNDRCYLSPGCMDEVRGIQRRLGNNKHDAVHAISETEDKK